jgi:hypothetical protein
MRIHYFISLAVFIISSVYCGSGDSRFSGAIYYLIQNDKGKYEINKYDFDTGEHVKQAELGIVLLGDIAISRDGKYAFYVGFEEDKDFVVGVIRLSDADLNDSTKYTFGFGESGDVRFFCDDWEDKLYFVTFSVVEDEGVGVNDPRFLCHYVTRTGAIDMSFIPPKVVDVADGDLPLAVAVSKYNVYFTEYDNNSTWLLRRSKRGGKKEKVDEVPGLWFNNAVIVLNGEESYLTYRRVRGADKKSYTKVVTIYPLNGSPPKNKRPLHEFSIPKNYILTPAQPPVGYGVSGVVIEALNTVLKDGVYYKEVCLLDVTNGEITPLFMCPTSRDTATPHVFAWLDLPGKFEVAKNVGYVNNAPWYYE